MVSRRLLHRLGAAVAALGVALTILGVTSIVLAMTTFTAGPFTRWQEQLYYIIANLEAIVFRAGTGLAMTALGLYLRHRTRRELAPTEQPPSIDRGGEISGKEMHCPKCGGKMSLVAAGWYCAKDDYLIDRAKGEPPEASASSFDESRRESP